MKIAKRTATAAAMSLMVAAPMIAVAAMPAAAAPRANAAADSARATSCAPRVTVRNLTGRVGKAWTSGTGWTAIRTGPGAKCPMVPNATDHKKGVPNNTVLPYHCWTSSYAGKLWTHVRVKGTNINGWVYNGNLTVRMNRSNAPRAKC